MHSIPRFWHTIIKDATNKYPFNKTILPTLLCSLHQNTKDGLISITLALKIPQFNNHFCPTPHSLGEYKRHTHVRTQTHIRHQPQNSVESSFWANTGPDPGQYRPTNAYYTGTSLQHAMTNQNSTRISPIPDQTWLITIYQWLSARLLYLQCISTGDTAVLH